VPFLASDLEACPTPLLVMARDGDCGKHPWSEGSSHDGRQPPTHWAQTDTGLDWALSLTRWGFSLCRRLTGLASPEDADRCWMVDVVLLLLLWAWRRCWWCWASCRSSFSLRRGSWTAGKVPSEHALGRACMECDTECTQAEAILKDYLARTRAFMSDSKHSINCSWTLEEHHILLSLQEMDPKV
jgi:hypothetical protein